MTQRAVPSRWACVLAVLVVTLLAAACDDTGDVAPPTTDGNLCSWRELLNTEALRTARDKRNAELGEPANGESVVVAAEPDLTGDKTWAFHHMYFVSARDLSDVEGVDQHGRREHKRRYWVNGEFRSGYRSVFVGTDGWRGEFSAWEHCNGELERFASDEKHLLATLPLPDDVRRSTTTRQSNDDGLADWPCLVLAMPGSRLRVRDPVQSSVNGETLTTYEIVGFPQHAACPIRAIITLDEQLRIRGGKAWDKNTGQVTYSLTAGPAPGHPPIVDPSNQPVFGDGPGPPAPTTSIVAPGERPAP